MIGALADWQVSVHEHPVTSGYADCENCGEYAGRNGVYSTAGLMYVCDRPECLTFAIREAKEASDNIIQIEREVQVAAMEVAA